MRSTVRLRLTVLLATAAVTTALGAVGAPAASAAPGPSEAVLQHLRGTSSIVPSNTANVAWLGRKL